MFQTPFFRRGLPALEDSRMCLRAPVAQDYEEWAALREESRSFLAPWEPQWAPDELSRHAFRQRLKHYQDDFDHGTGVSFFLFLKNDGKLAGGITISNIRRGVAQCGQVGYWLGERFAGGGLMLNALNLLIPFSADRLRLHRLEAACIPSNKRSIHVLEKAGFEREGLLRSYLRINGSWQDHYLYAIVLDQRRDESRRD